MWRGREGHARCIQLRAGREWVYIVLDTQWEVLWGEQVVSNDRHQAGKIAGIQREDT